jgi:type IV pilus assembly protein PilW
MTVRANYGNLDIRRQLRGFTLVELMVALAVGLMILAGLLTFFINSNRTHAELKKTAEHTSNGSMAMSIMTQDISAAGYLGEFYWLPFYAVALPDPCVMTPAGIYDGLEYPVQAYNAPLISPLTCLSSANLVPGTDILVVRHAEFVPLLPTDVPTTGEVYIQALSTIAEVQVGAGGTAIGTTKKANGSVATILKKDGATSADIRKLSVHIYFVAPCSVPADGSDTCTGPLDDGGQPIPTLKRLELTAAAGTTVWRISPMAEGIRNLQLDFGIDSLPATRNFTTNNMGDGVPDTYATDASYTDWHNVVTIRVNLIATSTQFTTGYVDTKTYNLGLAGVVGPFNDAYKKHLFAGTARLNNVSGRREIPQ